MLLNPNSFAHCSSAIPSNPRVQTVVAETVTHCASAAPYIDDTSQRIYCKALAVLSQQCQPSIITLAQPGVERIPPQPHALALRPAPLPASPHRVAPDVALAAAPAAPQAHAGPTVELEEVLEAPAGLPPADPKPAADAERAGSPPAACVPVDYSDSAAATAWSHAWGEGAGVRVDEREGLRGGMPRPAWTEFLIDSAMSQ